MRSKHGTNKPHRSESSLVPHYILPRYMIEQLSQIKTTNPPRICTVCGHKIKDQEGMFRRGIHRNLVCKDCA